MVSHVHSQYFYAHCLLSGSYEFGLLPPNLNSVTSPVTPSVNSDVIPHYFVLGCECVCVCMPIIGLRLRGGCLGTVGVQLQAAAGGWIQL